MESSQKKAEFIFKPKLFWWYYSWILFLLFLSFGCTVFFGSIFGLIIAGGGNQISTAGYYIIGIFSLSGLSVWLCLSLTNPNYFKLNHKELEIKYFKKVVTVPIEQIKAICLEVNQDGNVTGTSRYPLSFVQRNELTQVLWKKINKYEIIPKKILNFWTFDTFYFELNQFLKSNQINIKIVSRRGVNSIQHNIFFQKISKIVLSSLTLMIIFIVLWLGTKKILNLPINCYSDYKSWSNYGSLNESGSYGYNICI
jgi:hypothetical protein